MSPWTQDAVDAWAASLLILARQRRGLTQRDLAIRAGVPQSTIARVETGQQQPSHPYLMRLLAAADFTLSARLIAYDDHDDVLYEQEQRLSAHERAAQQEHLVGLLKTVQ